MAIYLALSGNIRFLARTMSEYRFRSNKHATRYNIFSKEATQKEAEEFVKMLEVIRDYTDNDEYKILIEEKIRASINGLEALRNQSDEQYYKELRKNERIFDIKLFIRAHFKGLYRSIVNRK